ncbi:MAG TPA: hypothetical protein VFY11_13485 [Nocardioidaceae bacterium]|nr:hypothetical protein [Nocardioidaceae bacterium]
MALPGETTTVVAAEAGRSPVLVPTGAVAGSALLVMGPAHLVFGDNGNTPRAVLDPLVAVAWFWPLALVVAALLTLVLKGQALRRTWLVTVPWLLACMYYTLIPVHGSDRTESLVLWGVLLALLAFAWAWWLRRPTNAPEAAAGEG